MNRSKEYIATFFLLFLSYDAVLLLCVTFRNNNLLKCRIFLHWVQKAAKYEQVSSKKLE